MASFQETRQSLTDDLRRGGNEAREIGSEIAGIADDLRQIFQTETELAKAEMRESVQAAVRGAIWSGVTAVLGILLLTFLALAGMFALDLVMPLWAAALVTAGVILVLAAIGGFMAMQRFKQVKVMPSKAIGHMREDLSWAKTQLKSSVTSNGRGSHSTGA
jgi:uncharacterized membrane protein YqjE